MNTPKLNLFNTLTKTKEPFTPQNEKAVSLYVCGITPYDHAHIGHARAYVVFDVLFRTLKHLYEKDGGKVIYVRNFTDIDDKILARAQETGQNWQTLAQTFIDSYHADMAALNILPPTAEPRVTTSITPIIALIQKLEAKGIAYTALDGIYYDTSKVPTHDETRCWCNLPRAYAYGRLSGKDKNTERVARIHSADDKRSPADFALWKFAKAEEPESAKWESPWGAGRPGWHIECSAMAAENLGETIDIHGGGEDLQFPHHENEIAQSEGATGGAKPFVNYWLHNSFITVDGTKMSKSLGNFTTIKDALNKYSAGAIRLWLLQTHYRKSVDYSDEALKAAGNALWKIKKLLGEAYELGITGKVDNAQNETYRDLAANFISDDLDTSKLLSHFFLAADMLKFELRNNTVIAQESMARLLTYGYFLGLNIDMETAMIASSINRVFSFSDEVQKLIDLRFEARKFKNWSESDRLRDELKKHDIEVEDSSTGTTYRQL